MTSDRLVLASGSPRRAELLGRLGLDFTIEAADIDETVLAGEAAADYVRRLAAEKATAAARADTVVIAADTAVVVDGEILGKPSDRGDAARMLRRLAGRAHEVLTGVHVHRSPAGVTGVASTMVRLDDVDPDRIEWYTTTGEPDDKAGAYGLQGAAALFADHVEGSVTNVLGLPLPLLDGLFAELGLDLLDFRRTQR